MTAEITDFPKVAGSGVGLYGWTGSAWVKLSVDADGKLQVATTSTPSSYILIIDRKAKGTNGGTFTSGAWRTRDLNTEVADPGSYAAVASNQITLQPGTYQVEITAPGFSCGGHLARLQNITDGTTIAFGTSENSGVIGANNDTTSKSLIKTRFTISAAKVLEVQHWCAVTKATTGLGIATNIDVETYTTVELVREAA